MCSISCSAPRIPNRSPCPITKPLLGGILYFKDSGGNVFSKREIYANQEVLIGRDKVRCQHLLDDPYISQRHLRIYSVVFEHEEENIQDLLVYAEDLSRNGTFWNGSIIGRGNGGFLLSDGDLLRLSSNTSCCFESSQAALRAEQFDLEQEIEMKSFRNAYLVTDRLLGAGAFGRVFMAIEQRYRFQLACKVVDLRRLKNLSDSQVRLQERPEAAGEVDNGTQLRKVKQWGDQLKRSKVLEHQLSKYFREVRILASLSHPNIVSLEKVFVTDNTMYIFQDIVTAGDLYSYIESKNFNLEEAEAATIIRQILIAVSYLHEHNIVHRDLKPDNILVTSLSAGSRIVLTDFGTARRVHDGAHRMMSIVGTTEYAAPELLEYISTGIKINKAGYTLSVDLWAVGCITVVLLTGCFAFRRPSGDSCSFEMTSKCNLMDLEVDGDWVKLRERPKDFVRKLLVVDEIDRMTAKEALQHPWFTNEAHRADFDDLYQRTIKDWRPRPRKHPILEFRDAPDIQRFKCSQGFVDKVRKRRRGPLALSAIEPPYKPCPRNMYLSLWPKRNTDQRGAKQKSQADIVLPRPREENSSRHAITKSESTTQAAFEKASYETLNPLKDTDLEPCMTLQPLSQLVKFDRSSHLGHDVPSREEKLLTGPNEKLPPPGVAALDSVDCTNPRPLLRTTESQLQLQNNISNRTSATPPPGYSKLKKKVADIAGSMASSKFGVKRRSSIFDLAEDAPDGELPCYSPTPKTRRAQPDQAVGNSSFNPD